MMEKKPRSCFGRRRENEEEFRSRLEQERQEGRALLRKMVVKSDDLDWQGVIKKAEELHRKEERNISRRERKCRQRVAKKVLSERKKVDAVCSFSVNLLTMKTYEEDNTAVRQWRQRVNSVTSVSVASSLDDDDSDSPSSDVSSVYAPVDGSGDHRGSMIYAQKVNLAGENF